MFIVYRLLFSIPAIVAMLWFFFGLLLQTIGELFSAAWAVGLVVQVALAIYLVIKMRTNS
jgi:hypothetical protein